jgi:hypothetical protein
MTLAAFAPILFLPARLETRFGSSTSGTPQLWVRLFPDQIAIDSHDPRLTDEETAAGQAYWDALWRLGTATGTDERPPWRVLAASYGATRAAWVAERTRPDNLAQRPPAATTSGATPAPPIQHRVVPADERRSSTWERAATGAGLPARWVVAAYRGGQRLYLQEGQAIPPDLQMGPDPNAPAVNADIRDLQIDAGLRWMFDFSEAVAVGMAMRIDLNASDAATGFDRVIAFGLGQPRYRGPMVTTHVPQPPASANEEIAQLFESHRFGDGLAFIAQGTAANNTAEAQRAYTSADPGFERSFRSERAAPLPQRDGAVAAALLGLPPSSFEHIEGADREEQELARQMVTAVWPATLGYVIRNLLDGELTARYEDALRRYVRDMVHGRGPMPAIAIGDTPYGVLPVTSVSRWQPTERTPIDDALVTFLRRVLPVWKRSVAAAPQIHRGGNTEKDLLEVLGMDASAQSYRARHALLDELVLNWFFFLRLGSEAEWLDTSQQVARTVLSQLGYSNWDPEFAHLLFSRKSFEVPFSIIQNEPLSESNGLTRYTSGESTGNYISWLRSASVDDIREERYPTGTAPTSLLYKVLRHSVLLESANTVSEIRIAAGTLDRTAAREPVFVGFATRPSTTAYEVLDAPLVEGGVPAKVHLYNLSPQDRASPEYGRLEELRAALDKLANVPTAELERLFTETLDCFSHRLEAWVTSLATQTLAGRRRAGVTATHRGMYAWVEDLRPAVRTAATGPELALIGALDTARAARNAIGASRAPLRAATTDVGGFIHAPSLAQAEAGAVLRHGYLSHFGTSEGKALGLDLSSDRVRLAVSFIDGVRQGQPLAALLGYRFERALHQAQLDVYLEGVRARFPVVANKIPRSDEVPAPAAETVAASNVVDGLALYRAWSEGRDIWADEAPSESDRATVKTIMGELDDAIDALGDVSIAESVHQVMRGNFTRAGGLVDALSRGEAAPEPEVLATPRTGFDVTHRLAVLFTTAQVRPTTWPQLPAHPRVAAEGILDAWLASLLPDPQSVRCRVEATAAGAPQVVSVTLADLGLAPLDLLPLGLATDEPQSSELEQRIVLAASAALPADATDLRIVFEGAALALGAQERSFPELLVLLRAARDLISGARPLGPQDLIEPDKRVTKQDQNIDAADIEQRAKAALTAFNAAMEQQPPPQPIGLAPALAIVAGKLDQTPVVMPTAAEVTALRAALRSASFFGVPGSVPVNAKLPPNTADPAYEASARALRAQADEVLRTMRKRARAADNALAGWDAAEQRPAVRRDRAIALAKLVLGSDFVLLPTFTPPDGAALATAIAGAAGLLAGDDLATARWLQQLTHVRPGVSRFDFLGTAAQLVVGGVSPTLTIAQLPTGATRWVALPPQPADVPASPGAASIVLQLVGPYDATRPHAGLMVDEWIERIPSAEETTGVAFHADAPGSRAPNALLLAVSPDPEIKTWTGELILEILGDALDLAGIRTVDLDSLSQLGQLLPALFFPFNPDGQTVSVDAIG